MATYAIGDIQGCFDSLQRLLNQFHFDPGSDRLWLVGDLVNRGPDSLSVLRYIKNLGDSAITVLGNHDLHLLAVEAGIAELHRKDTITDVLKASDRKELIDWLRHQRLMYREGGFVLVHAGVFPYWSVDEALQHAQEVETALRSDQYTNFLQVIYRCSIEKWNEEASLEERLGVITNAMTRMRICSEKGELNLGFKGMLEDIPAGYFPWFDVPSRIPRNETVLFGHWSALGVRFQKKNVALDGGCVWGRKLVAFRLDDRQSFEVSCTDCDIPDRS